MQEILIERLLNAVRTDNMATVAAPIAQRSCHWEAFPDDLKTFYMLCNGLGLCATEAAFALADEESDFLSAFTWHILGQDEVAPLPENIVPRLCPQTVTRDWLVIGKDRAGNLLALDLHPQRFGWCYDLVQDKPPLLLNFSFKRLLNRLVCLVGSQPEWRMEANYNDRSLNPGLTKPPDLKTVHDHWKAINTVSRTQEKAKPIKKSPKTKQQPRAPVEPTDIAELVNAIRLTDTARVDPRINVRSRHWDVLPEELKVFYTVCNGFFLQWDIKNDCSIDGLFPWELRGQDTLEEVPDSYIDEGECQIAKEWLVIGDDFHGNYLAVDTNPERLGWCYDVLCDAPPMRLAFSFGGLLKRLMQLSGEMPDWRTLENTQDYSVIACFPDDKNMRLVYNPATDTRKENQNY